MIEKFRKVMNNFVSLSIYALTRVKQVKRKGKKSERTKKKEIVPKSD